MPSEPTLSVGPERRQSDISRNPLQRWLTPDGLLWTAVYRLDPGYLVRFPGMADFRIRLTEASVECIPVPGTDEPTLLHLFHNQVVPLVMSGIGRLVFHASVVGSAGQAVAFVGASGSGKSTLAASFGSAGCFFLADDVLLVQREGGSFRAEGGNPWLRLWSDSRNALARSCVVAPAVKFSDKARLLSSPELRHLPGSWPLRRVYFLDSQGGADIRMAPISPHEACLRWVQNSFLLDPADDQALAHQFEGVVALANSVPAFTLDFPRRYEQLPALRDAITTHSSG